MSINLLKKLVVVISSRALFDLEESHKVYVDEGVDAYCRYQVERENEVFKPGVAFLLVRKLLNINTLAEQGGGLPGVEVILLSRNSADTGLRVFNSIKHYGLPITRAAFTNGSAPWRYVQPFQADLFLSTEASDVRLALESGFAAASIWPGSHGEQGADDKVRIAFDGDAVLFSDESERIYKEQGLAKFQENEESQAHTPMKAGPFKNFLYALQQIQQAFPADQAVITTALVTARSAPAHERVIRTLRDWGIRIDQALFLGGMAKGEFLKAFEADIFFDDQTSHIESASSHVPSGHVPSGVANDG